MMKWVDSNGRVLGRWNLLDFAFLTIILLAVLGVFLVQSGLHITSGQVVEGEADTITTVLIPNLRTLDKTLFKAGGKTAITIRNQPRGEVVIESATFSPVQIPFLGANNQAISVEDISQKSSYDVVLRLKDHAKVTADGFVSEGVKVKIGLPIELEGFKYRVFGKIIDIEAVKGTETQKSAKAG